MTERKRWPNVAEWAREDSLALAQRGLQKSRTLQEHSWVQLDPNKKPAQVVGNKNRLSKGSENYQINCIRKIER